MKYRQPHGESNANASYVDENAGAGILGSIPPAAAIEDPQREIVNAIDAILGTGAFGTGQDAADLTQLLKILRYNRTGRHNVQALAQQNSPPGAPALGDTYIVGTSPAGAWVGQANALAWWAGAAWRFAAPVSGLTVTMMVGSVPTLLTWNGTAWINALQDVLGRALIPTLTIFTASGTWTKPANLVFARIRMVGGGGGGGLSSSPSAQNFYGGGGGNGAYAEQFRGSAATTATVAVTIGAGGTGRTVAAGVGAGTAGGTTLFGGYFSAAGGAAGGGSAGANGAGGNGGTASFAHLALQGTRGADGFELAGVTFPTPLGDFGRGGQGGYQNLSTLAQQDANNGLPGYMVIEEYRL